MRIDLPEYETWSALSGQYKAVLAEINHPLGDPQIQVQIYAGYQHGLWEVTKALAGLFSHKKTIAIVDKVEPAFESLAMAFAEEGYSIKVLSREDLEQPSAWMGQIQAELLFVLMSEDDPITSAVRKYDALNEALKDKRIFKISVSHALYRVRPPDRPAPFDVRILSLTPERALLVAGERCRVQPPVVSRLPWTLATSQEIHEQIGTLSLEDSKKFRDAVSEFESRLPAGFLPFFKTGDERVFDRAVIHHPEFDGLAVIDGLAREAGVRLPSPGRQAALESTSPCRWENPRFAEWLVKSGHSEEIIRGMVVISAEHLVAEGTAKVTAELLTRAADAIRKIQSGN
jgi:hypothetical protein